MIRYEQYLKEFGMRRPTDISSVTPYSNFIELPVGSVLHLGDCIFKDVSKKTNPMPDVSEFSHFTNEKRMLFFFENNVDNNKLIDNKDIGRIVPFKSATESAVRKFRSPSIKTVKGIYEFPFTNTIQNIVSYDPLYCGNITGIMQRYRMTMLTLNNMLTNVQNNVVYDHFIILKTRTDKFALTDFTKTFKEYSRQYIAYPESPYYIVLMNILGFLYEKPTESIFEKISQEALSKLNIIFVNEHSDVSFHVRLDKLKAFMEKDKSVIKKFINTMNTISTVGGTPLSKIDPNENILKVNASIGDGGDNNITQYTKPLTKNEYQKQAEAMLKDSDTQAIKNIATDKNLSLEQKKYFTSLSKQYKAIKVGDQTIEEIILDNTDETVGVEDISQAVNIPDTSMTTSSLDTFTEQYMNKMFKRDMVMCLSSFNKHGMYLVDLKEEEVTDELSSLIKYTAKFKDKDGTIHTIKFSMPKVDKDGNFTINGSEKRMGMQRINNPICKIGPTKVSLRSSFNNSLVEINSSFNNSIAKKIHNLLSKTKLDIKGILGTPKQTEATLPHEYTAISNFYVGIKGLGLNLTFNYEHRFDKAKNVDTLKKIEIDKSVVYYGTIDDKPAYINIDGEIITNDKKYRLIDILSDRITDVALGPYNEWANFIILNKPFPIMFVLAYRFGFEHILKYLSVNYNKIPKGSKTNAKASDIIIKMSDYTFVIENPTTVQRFIVSGINNFNLKEIESHTLEEKDVYYSLVQSRGYSIEYIRGIDTTFDLFIDPITEDVLRQMNEPTNMRDLLIRSVVLLSTSDHKESASATMFRYRSYEQMNAIAYKTIGRAFAAYQHKSIGHKSKFSISEYEVLKNILTDPLVENVDIVNPVGDIKSKSRYTHIGDGGRSKDSMMISDRRYPIDGMGTMSEATVDSGKVGIDGVLPADPTITNLRGMTLVKDVKDLTNANLLSSTALLYPGATNDDSKRANFLNIQMSQFIPIEKTNLCRVRTGYERVVAHRVEPPFAFVAEEDGKILDIDKEASLIKIEYKSGKKYAIEYGEIYSKNSSGSFYVTQRVAINDFDVGNRFKKGDVIAYNDSYFSNDQTTKQVDLRLGYNVNVALIDNAATHEDSCAISKHMSEALTINPVEERIVTISKDTVIHKIAVINTKIKSTSPLMIFDETILDENVKLDDELAEVIAALNKSIPKAKYTGVVVDIKVLHRCEYKDMSPSVKKFVKYCNTLKNTKHNFCLDTENSGDFKEGKPLVSDKFKGSLIDKDSIIIKFFIKQTLGMGVSDKIVVGSSLKSICSSIIEGGVKTQDNRDVDVMMGAASVWNRIISTPVYHGGLEAIMEKIEQDMLSIYFD